MGAVQDTTDLQDLLQRIKRFAEKENAVKFQSLLEAVGMRSYGPMVLLLGLLAVSPLSGIPGVPSAIGVVVTLVSVQMLAGRDHFWLPDFITRRSIDRDKLLKALKWLRRPAGVVDRMVRPRWTRLTHGLATYGIAILCLLIAITMPPLELLPFVASTSGVALATFGLALVARDGLVALIGMTFTGVIAWLAITQLLL